MVDLVIGLVIPLIPLVVCMSRILSSTTGLTFSFQFTSFKVTCLTYTRALDAWSQLQTAPS